MPNEYSVKIHDYLTEKISEAERGIARGDEQSAFYHGQLEELQHLREYLKKHIDLKDFTYY